MKKLISRISKIFNKIFLYTLYFLIFVLYLILFEIPIPFVASKVEQMIYENNKESFDKNNVDFSIQSVSLGWNYNINRPVVIIKGISYKQGNYSINLSKIGFYPSIKNVIKEKELFLEKIFFEGLNLIVTSDEKEGYKIQLDNNYLIVNDTNEESSQANKDKQIKKQESFLEKIQKKEDFKESRFYQLLLDIKQDIPVLKYLNEFIIYKSNIIFINQQKRLLILDVANLSLSEYPEDILINLKSSLTFDNDTGKLSKLIFNGSINSNNIVKWDLSLEKMLLANFHNYVIKDNYLKDLDLDGFEGNISFTGFYNTLSGLENFNSTVDVKQGKLSYKNYISKPMKINSLSYNLFYDKKADIINVKGFNINFANNNKLSSDKLGLTILLNKLNADLKFDFKDNSLVVDKLRLFSGTNKVDLFLDYLPYSSSKQGYLELEVDSSNLDVGFVQQSWPKNYFSEVRKWILTNVSNGKIDKTSFKMNLALLKNSTKIKALEGDVFLSDVKLTYLKGLPIAEAKKTSIKYDMDIVSIKYNNATTGNIISKSGELKFYNNSKLKNKHETALFLDLDINSKILDLLLFIDNKPLDLLKETGLDASKLSGNAAGNIKLDYLFETNEVVNKDIKLALSNVSFIDVLPKINVSDADIKLLINDGGLKINGLASVFNERIETSVQVNWENSKNIIQTYSVDVKNFPIEKLYNLDFLDKKIIDMAKGHVDGEFNYYKDSKLEKLSFYNDLTNALFYIDTFNYKSKVGEKLIIEGVSIFKNKKIQEIKKLKLNSSDLSASINIEFGDGENKKLYFNNFYIKNKASFKGSIDFSENMKSFNIKGSFLDLEPLFSYFKGNNNMDTVEEDPIINKEIAKKKRGIILRKETKQEEEQPKEAEEIDIPQEDRFESINTDDASLSQKIGNISLKLNFNKIVNGNESIHNASFNLLWKDSFMELLSFSANMDSSKENSYAIFDDRASILGFRIQNVGNLLRLLDFSSQIKGGDLEGKVDIKKIVSQNDKNKFYIETKGQFVLNNFSAGLSFATAYGSFRGKDLYFRVDQLELQGNLMGGSIKGYVDVKKREIDLYGKLIPIWSANNLLTNAPILKSLFNNVTIAKNLIQINARLKGSFDDIKYSVFSRDLQKGDIVNELNYYKLGEDINNLEPKDQEAKQDLSKEQEDKLDSPKEQEDKLDSPKEQEDKQDLSKEQEDKLDSPKDQEAKLDLSKEQEAKLDLPKDQEAKQDLSKDQEDKQDLPKE